MAAGSGGGVDRSLSVQPTVRNVRGSLMFSGSSYCLASVLNYEQLCFSCHVIL